jgi:hypothetical protein
MKKRTRAQILYIPYKIYEWSKNPQVFIVYFTIAPHPSAASYDCSILSKKIDTKTGQL